MKKIAGKNCGNCGKLRISILPPPPLHPTMVSVENSTSCEDFKTPPPIKFDVKLETKTVSLLLVDYLRWVQTYATNFRLQPPPPPVPENFFCKNFT